MSEAIVVGGGLSGVAAAIAVAKSGLQTLHLAPKGPRDARTSALMGPSVDYLQRAGLIGAPEALGHALTEIRIIDATSRIIRAPETLFRSTEAGLPAFGWNFSNAKLMQAFEAARQSLPNLETREIAVTEVDGDAGGARLTLGDGSRVEAPLLVGADGKKSLVRAASGFRARENGFVQAALVCDLELARPIGGTSVEFHYPQGPFTLVPAGDNRANLVWIDDREVLKAAQAGGSEHLARLFREKAQNLFGTIALLTPTHVFPLSSISVDVAGRKGVVLVGEAAHAFPPIGAQGLNLGLRDVDDLASALAARDGKAGWAERVSTDYARRRSGDLVRTGGMVDTLFRSLLSDFLPAQAMRSGGLWALKLLPGLRKQAFAVGMGVR